VARFLKANPTTTATVEGHTSNLQGSPEEAMDLSELRAENVVSYLADNFDIPRSRLTAEGFGETRRVSYNTSAEGQKDNRRVNIIINYARSR
jgi:OOP family OmpA-OmpF porin